MRADLMYQGGGSDKVYHVWTEAVPGGWDVRFEYGRRGAALVGGKKNGAPLSQAAADRLGDRIAGEKRGKGYWDVEGSARVPYTLLMARETPRTSQLPAWLQGNSGAPANTTSQQPAVPTRTPKPTGRRKIMKLV